MMSSHELHILLVLFLFAMYALVIAYLRRRRMSFSTFAFWGILAMFIPALGPFLVIAIKPGHPAVLSTHSPRQ
jgi:hypothetical protein